MEKDFSVRPYQPGDEEGIVGLLDLVFGGWPNFDLRCSPLDHWWWKYRGGPIKADDIIVCLKGDKIIGCKHSIPLKVKVGDEVLSGNIGSDLTVHPDFRNIGLSKEIRRVNRELKKRIGYQISYFVTSNPILIESYSKTRPPFPHTVANYVLIRDIDLHLRMMPAPAPWLKKMGFHALKTYHDSKNILGGYRRIEIRTDISQVPSFDERIDGLWDEVSPRYKFIVERRRDYLNWRYCHLHAGNYVVRQAEEDGRIAGYSVLLINGYNESYPVGYIVDLLTRPDRLDVADDLIADALNYFDDRVNITNALALRKHPHVRILEKHGFLDSRIDLKLFLGSSTAEEQLEALRKSPISGIHFSYGDIDSLPSSTLRYA